MRKLGMEELNRKSVDDFKKAEKLPLVVLLENIRSMHNVGSAFRSSDAFLVEKIILAGYTPRPPHRDIQKTALGATESVDWTYVPDSTMAIAEWKAKGYSIYSVEQVEGSMLLQDSASGLTLDKVVLIFGNEVEGVSKERLLPPMAALKSPRQVPNIP